ncbi:c-type cytochrome [Aestuariivita boseongensis]|uniref:c-type cytochrome n=1 Tax=Aestuariivita boseongensis TaxID=1470562 RepID=UPI000682610B|nr:cytochrome c [Aestuariivita boseongensis]
MRLLMMSIPYLALAGLATCAPVPRAEGAKLFARNCAACHGAQGRGDGPEAAALPRAPADLTQIAARNDGVFPAADVIAVIHGYRGQNLHALMPEFGSLLESPDVLWTDPATGERIPTPSALVALTDYVNDLQSQ